MGIQLHWDDDAQTIAYFEVDGPWTWDDLNAAMDQLYAMQDAAGHKIHSIVDLRAHPHMPQNILDYGMKRSRRGESSGMVVFVGSRGFLRGIMGALARLYPVIATKIQFVDTPEAARAAIVSLSDGS